MAYRESSIKKSEIRQRQESSLVSREELLNRKPDPVNFFEYEAAVVVDIILDDKHPIFSINKGPQIDTNNYPGKPDTGDIDYSYIGRALVRMVVSDAGKPKETLSWAIPINGTGGEEYPLKNEIVYVVKYLEQLFYGKVNVRNFINNNADFKYEKKYGLNNGVEKTNVLSYTRNKNLPDKNANYVGSLGDYFKSNDNIRAIRRYEGDSVIESRFGQSIRFSAYDNERKNDIGDVEYKNYYDGGGNPMILIRNRQRDSKQIDTGSMKNVGGIVNEDINNDGSSIHITSGLTVSNWDKNTISTQPFPLNTGSFSSNFSPVGSSDFTYPVLSGDQIIKQSDRIIISARKNELFMCSKKRMSLCTDAEFNTSSEKQSVFISNDSHHILAPLIFLGDYGVVEEPIMLGSSTAKWLFELIDWLKVHTHIYKHTHANSPNPSPDKTQITPELAGLISLQSRIPQLISDRVYTVGRNTLPTNRIVQVGNPPSIISKIPSR